MKKGKVLNSHLSAAISTLGHFDLLTINDAGMPLPNDERRIDLAVTQGLPLFIDVLKNVLNEMEIQRIFLAEEIKTNNPSQLHDILELIDDKVEVVYIPHSDLKNKLNDPLTKANVRTGEITPYSNIALESNVTF